MRVRIAAVAIVFSTTIAVSFTVLRAQEQPSAPRSVWDGVYTKDQAERGHSVYSKNCEKCHGDSLEGGDEVPTIEGPQFLSEWDDLTLGDLFDRIRKSMPQDTPGRLSREENADVMAFLLGANGFPAGKTELAHQSEVLAQIRIQANKPDPKNDK